MAGKKHTVEPPQDGVNDETIAETKDSTDTAKDGMQEEKEDSGKHGAEPEEQVEHAEVELAELRDKYLRLFAEFDNYKKRTIREKLDLMRTAAQDTLTALLPILDDFDRAKKIADDPSTTEHFSEGVELVYQKLYSTLNSLGLREMESTGQDFDAGLHEAVSEIPVPDDKMKGKVVDTIEKGYFLHDKIIRHAKVVIGK